MQVWGWAAIQEQTVSSSSQAVPSAGGELGKDEFLRLLITQLRYQDPIDPVSDQEFLAQMAQFSALEQMNNVAAQLERLADFELRLGVLGQAVSLLNRTVVLNDPDTGGTVTGRVEAVKLEDGEPVVVVGGRRFSLTNLVEVRPD
ncbi:MAG: flagellar hook capping protein [Firmicutes bacterium]|nr:flagellar hook capping protein [Bacillota bacterium]